MKNKFAGASKGHSLLKKKSDALTLKFRAILTKILGVRIDIFARVCNDILLGQRIHGVTDEGCIFLSCGGPNW